MLRELGARFHHLGVACRNIEFETAAWVSMGYKSVGADFRDATQLVHGRFLVGTGPRLELLCPLSSDSPVQRVLSRGEKIYHHAFVVPDLNLALSRVRGHGAKEVVKPTIAIAFAGAQIAFVMLRNLNLIELIEGQPNEFEW